MTAHRTVRATATIALLLSLVIPSGVAHGDSASDIPGIPLPGPTATGLLGGPIYDVVYRLDVPAGYVIVAGMTGTPATDFDLYLFDASATTVVNNAGLLTKSTGPTSTEQLSWPTRIGGTFYLDLNGASDVEGSYELSVQIVPDPTPPTARLLVADGATTVNTPQVTLQLIGFDDLSGVTEMSLSSDGVNYLPAQPIQSQFTWTLTPADGPKSIWARVVNGVGLVSAPATVTVVLDTVGPAPVSVTPAKDAIVASARPPISVQFDEAIDPATWINLGLVVQSSSGAIVSGNYGFDTRTNTGVFTPTTDLAPGYVYIVTLGGVQDLAGNRVRDAGSWTLKRLLPVSVSVGAAPAVLTFGASSKLAGVATGVPVSDPLALDTKAGGAADYAPVQSLTLAGAAYALEVAPSMNTWYRVSYPGSTTVSAATASVRVLVRRKLAILGPAPSTTRIGVSGRSVTLIALVGPAGVTSVSFRLYRYDPLRGVYVYVRSFGRTTDSSGRAALVWVPSPGRYAWRIATAPSVEFANNLTPAYRWSVGS